MGSKYFNKRNCPLRNKSQANQTYYSGYSAHHPLIGPELNQGYANLHSAYHDTLKSRIEESETDMILVYSTTWQSIVGRQSKRTQIQNNPCW